MADRLCSSWRIGSPDDGTWERIHRAIRTPAHWRAIGWGAHSLRGYDAIQLACALAARDAQRTTDVDNAANGRPVLGDPIFLTEDNRLAAAASPRASPSILPSRISERAGSALRATCAGAYLPMQNSANMRSSRPAVAVSPVISPRASSAARRLAAISVAASVSQGAYRAYNALKYCAMAHASALQRSLTQAPRRRRRDVERKLTITLSDDVYQGLEREVGPEHISEFIESLLRPLVTGDQELEAAYREMAADADREQEAMEWIEAHPDEALDAE